MDIAPCHSLGGGTSAIHKLATLANFDFDVFRSSQAHNFGEKNFVGLLVKKRTSVINGLKS